MQGQTKNTLTRELLEKELRFYNTADIKSTLLLGGILAFFFVPITIGFVNWISSSLDNVFVEIVLGIIGGVVISSPIWIHVLLLAKTLWERKMLHEGKFDITIRQLSYKSEKMVQRKLKERLHFDGFKAVTVPHTTYQLASHEDEFYIVHYISKNSVKLLYPLKIYEYSEK